MGSAGPFHIDHDFGEPAGGQIGPHVLPAEGEFAQPSVGSLNHQQSLPVHLRVKKSESLVKPLIGECRRIEGEHVDEEEQVVAKEREFDLLKQGPYAPLARPSRCPIDPVIQQRHDRAIGRLVAGSVPGLMPENIQDV